MATTNTTVTAPELTAEQVATVLTRPLETASTFLACGPRIFDTAGPLRIPSLGGAIDDPGWTGEAENIPERVVDFGEVSLLPSTMKSVKVLTRYSNELARQSVVNLDQALKDRLVADVAAKLDAQFWSASGDGVTTPRGIFAMTGTQSVPVDGPLTLDAMLTAWGMALSANVNMSALRWVLTPGDFVSLRGVKDTAGRYLMQADPTQDGVFRVWGAPVTITPRLADTTGASSTGRGVLADFSQIAVARDLAPSVKVLTETFADTDEQALRVVARYDVAPLNPQAIVVLKGITRGMQAN